VTIQLSARVEEATKQQLQGWADALHYGNLTDAVEWAVGVWADALERAAAENAQTICPEAWCLIADVCNGTPWDRIGNPAVMLAANVEDGHKFNRSGFKWFDGPADSINRSVAELVRNLAALDHAHAWAVVLAVTWFWQHSQDQIDALHDPWWNPKWRREFRPGPP
jgi:hypothetical protein